MEDGRFSNLSPPGASPQLLWLPNGEMSSLSRDSAFPQLSSWTGYLSELSRDYRKSLAAHCPEENFCLRPPLASP